MATKTLSVVITGDAKGALMALANTKGGLSGLASQLKTLPGFAATAGVAIGAGLVAAGVGLFKLGQDFDDAFDTIRTQTGATGKTLEGLKGSFKNVFASVPTDMDSAAMAIAGLNQRLDLTGKPLERLAMQVLELSRLTGEDLQTAIESTSRVMGDWSIPAGKQSKVLDELFRASQQTGIGVNDLAQKVVQFGAPMRQFGFSFEESAALIAKWEKEGVNAEAVLAGLKVGLGKLLKAGKDPVKVLRELQASFAATGGTGADVTKVLEIFGTRAGPDMVAALREGRFSIDDLLKSIKGGKETIRGAARDTNDFGETWNILKNQVLVALEPIATRVFNAISNGMKALVPIINDLRAQWPQIADGLRPVMAVVEYIFDNVVSRVKASLDGIIGIIKFFGAILKGDWGRAWEAVKQILRAAWDSIKAIFKPAVDALRFILAPVLAWMGSAWRSVHDVMRAVTTFAWTAISGAIRFVWSNLIQPVFSAFGAAAGFVRHAIEVLRSVVGAAFSAIGSAMRSVYNNTIGPVLDLFRAALQEALNIVQTLKDIANLNLGGPTGGSFPVPGAGPGRAEGGPVTRGRAYVVGERGPELFVPSGSGQIIPNGGGAGRSGGAGSVTVKVYVSPLTSPADTGRAVADALAAYLKTGGVMPTARVASGA